MTWNGPAASGNGGGHSGPVEGEVLGPVVAEIMTEAQIEQLIDTIVAITSRDPKLWMNIDSGADPYLGADGCKLVQTAFHIDVTDIKANPKEDLEEDDENGDPLVSYSFNVYGERPLPGGQRRRSTGYGECTTGLKAILSQRSRFDDRGKAREPSMVRGDQHTRAKEMARARAFNQMITGILGIPAITWDDLEKRGMGRDAVKQRGEKSGGKGKGGGAGGGRGPDTDFLWAVLKGEVEGFDKDSLGNAVKQALGHFKTIKDMSVPEQAKVAAVLRGESAPADNGPEYATAEQRDQFLALVNELGLDGDVVLKKHGWSGDGARLATTAAAAIADLEARTKAAPPSETKAKPDPKTKGGKDAKADVAEAAPGDDDLPFDK